MSQFVYCYIVWKPHKLVYAMAAEKGHMTILEGKLHKLRINLCKRSYPGCNINFFMVITSYKNIVFYTPQYLFLFGICQTNILTSKFHPVLNMSACFKVCFFPPGRVIIISADDDMLSFYSTLRGIWQQYMMSNQID